MQRADVALVAELAEHAADREAALEAVEHARVDVGGACDRRRVAEVAGDLLHRAVHRALAGGLRPSARRGPDTASATAASTVAFHVRKSLAEKSPPVTSFTYALMSDDLRSRQRRPSLYASSSGDAASAALQLLDDLVHLAVDDRLDAPLAALRRVVEQQRAVVEQLHVTLVDRREPVALVLDGVVLAADAEEAAVEQPHGAGEHALARHPFARRGARRRARASPAARARSRSSRRTSAGRAARATCRGSGTACARARRSRWPGCGPSGYGQIHTSSQAGGITSSRMRVRVSSSVRRVPSWSRYSNPLPRRRRRIPGPEQSARLQPGHGLHLARGAQRLNLRSAARRAAPRGCPR